MGQAWYYVQAILIVVGCTFLVRLLSAYFTSATLIMIYLFGVVIVAARCGRGPSIMASLLSVALFDFFYVPPYLTLAVADTQYVVTFAVMLLVAITISTLAARLQRQAATATDRERRTASLYAMSRVFANEHETESMLRTAAQHIGAVFASQVVVLVPNHAGQLGVRVGQLVGEQSREASAAQWVFEHGKAAGAGKQMLPDARGLYVPLITSRGVAGVMGVYSNQQEHLLSPGQLNLLETFANQMALALERTRLSEEAEHAQVEIEAERLRNLLLSSVSHDLRTPLAAITGAVSSLLENEATLGAQNRRELAQVAYEEAERLNRLVGNLLEMTRLESGGVQVQKEWQPLEEVVGTTLSHLKRVDDHPLTTHLPPDLPPVPLDGVLIEQVLVNLLENAAKYSPPGSPITLTAQAGTGELIVEVADRGPGLQPGDELRVFDKFYRARPTTASGVGLGLTISNGIIKAHGGRMWAENRSGGGAIFRFTLPLTEAPPELEAGYD